MTNPNVIRCEYLYVEKITRNGHGGVIFNDADSISLFVYYCSFHSCHVTNSQFNGGCIYFKSTACDIETSKVSATSSSSYKGHCMYIEVTNRSPAMFSLMNIEGAFGNDRACFMSKGPVEAEVSDYNSSFCTTKVHCNIHFFNSYSVKKAYLNFLNNTCDILCGVDVRNAEYSYHNVSCANFIGNTYNIGRYGLLYTKSNEDFIFNCTKLLFYENNHVLVYSYSGIIDIKDVICDKYEIGSLSGKINDKSIEQSQTNPFTYNFVIFDEKCNTCHVIAYESKKHLISLIIQYILLSPFYRN